MYHEDRIREKMVLTEKDYNFPVELQSCYTDTGKEIPGVKTVVRLDTNIPISSVSPRYRIITHSDAMASAYRLMESLGMPQTTIEMSPTGAALCAISEYKDITKALKVGDVVGLRLLARNSYNRTSAFSIKVGLKVLSCMNGMVSHKDYFDIKIRHTGSGKIDFQMPSPAMVHEALEEEVQNINSYSLNRLEDPDVLIFDAQRRGLLTQEGVEFALGNRTAESTVWDLYQSFTNHITHTRQVSPIARENLLERTSRFFDDMVNHNGYYDLLLEQEQGRENNGSAS